MKICVLYLNNTVEPICLPPEDFEDIEQKCDSLGTCEQSDFMPHSCIGSGWGRINVGDPLLDASRGKYPENQRWGKMTIWKQSVCLKHGELDLRGKIFQFLCAGNANKDDTSGCDGDSGGPLACIHNDRMVLVGIFSAGHPNCTRNHPGIFTRVKYYIDWIRNYTVYYHFW